MSNIKFTRTRAKSYIKWITFSDNTETCKIVLGHPDDSVNCYHLQVNIEDATRDLVRIGLVKDALERIGVPEITLHLPYFPQARADRVFEVGNPLPVRVFTGILNSYGFKKVTIYDPHSDVTPALINNCEVLKQDRLLKMALPVINKQFTKEFTLCAPDLGATKKTFDNMVALGQDKYYQAIKVRDVKTGDIIKCDLIEDKIEGDVLIVDDICDGSASFKFLAQKLKEKGAEKVGLYVTHGIFSKGLEVLKGSVDYIYVTNLVGNYVNQENIRKFNES